MNKLRRNYKSFAVILIIAVMTIFIVLPKSVNAASVHSCKFVNILIRTPRKHIVTPNQARNFLNDLDMPTRDYIATGESGPYGKYGARSDYFILETRDSNRYINNLTYYVSGNKYAAKAVELDLNVNDLSFKTNAIAELIKYSDGLMHKVTGKSLTPSIKKAIQTQTKGEWIINGYKIKLEKEIFPDEKIIKGEDQTSDHGAFSLTFIIEL